MPPTVYNLKNVTGAEGHEVTLVCLSYGDPAPTMSFRKTSKSKPYIMGENVNISLLLFLLCNDQQCWSVFCPVFIKCDDHFLCMFVSLSHDNK